MPMDKWVDHSRLITFDDGVFKINFEVMDEDKSLLHQMTQQICEYRLHVYFERKGYTYE